MESGLLQKDLGWARFRVALGGRVELDLMAGIQPLCRLVDAQHESEWKDRGVLQKIGENPSSGVCSGQSALGGLRTVHRQVEAVPLKPARTCQGAQTPWGWSLSVFWSGLTYPSACWALSISLLRDITL